ncbi:MULTISPECIES: MarR family transcriptional regulator [unclassified Nocardioides]|uniref:MarR family winged helix-turn-helix transcriptional regulator n=1 Tax=unclassified Nocardioides TaxID=2615069 RepID=UPI00059FF2A9|nr:MULTISPECIES: MarR family transcriptional regulator [unclassified Nocardioides]MBI2243576.1 MarR family transcriptional regulator [Nocardioides sp.]
MDATEDPAGDPVDAVADAFVTASRALVGLAVHSIGVGAPEVTVAQFRLLVLLAASGERTVGDVAEHLGVAQSNASRHCDRLQRLGLVARRRSRSDGRVVRVRLTDEGRALVDAVDRRRRGEVHRLLGRMTPEERSGALEAMRAFSRAADELGERSWVVQAW